MNFRKIFLVWMVCGCGKLGVAQNYKSILPNQETFFKTSDGNIRGIKIKSAISVGADSVYYNFNSIRDTSNGNMSSPCPIDPNGPSWIGEKVIIRSDGYNIFFNSTKDSIRINTLASLANSWILYNFTNGDYIEATCTNIDTLTVLSNIDSVKIFSLQTRNSIGNQINSPFNNRQIILSKNWGIVRLFDWFNFPNDTTLPLIVNEKRYTTGEIYDFNVGDEFHNANYHFSDWTCSYVLTDYFVRQIISKTFSSNLDTVFYTTTGFDQHHVTQGSYSNWYWTQNEDSGSMAITNLNSFAYLPTMPDESYIDSLSISRYYMNLTSKYNWRAQIGGSYNCLRFDTIDSCFNYSYDNCIQTSGNSVKGCGAVFSEWQYCPSWGMISELIYFKKGNETWGTPVFPLGIPSQISNLKSQITISPNPTPTIFTLSINNFQSKNLKLNLVNILGEVVFSSKEKPANGNFQKQVDINSLPAGIYFLEIITDEERVTKKIIKE